MRIKTTKQMRLDELIKYVWENDIRNVDFVSNLGTDVYADNNALIVMPETYYQKGETYNVVVEEELTEETEIHGATLVYYNELSREIKPFRYADVTSPSLKHIIQSRPDTVALAVFSGKQLIWSKDAGIPAEGVIECS